MARKSRKAAGPGSSRKYMEAYINLISQAPNTKAVKHILERAPDPVFKILCNIANQILHNPRFKIVKTPPHKAQVLVKYKHLIQTLCAKRHGFKEKKRLLQRGGALPLLPILAGTALSTFGPMIFDAITSRFRKD